MTEEGVEVGSGSQTSDKVDGHLSFTLLPSGLGDSGEVSLTGLNNISRLGRNEGPVGGSSEWGGDGGNSHVVAEEAEGRGGEVGGGSQTGDKVDGHLSFTLLPAGLGNSGEVSRTGLNNICGLLGDKGSVGVSSEWGGDGGNSHVVAEVAEG